MNDKLCPVRVQAVAMPGEEMLPVVILQGLEGSLSVSVGAYEAGAILMQLEGLTTPRPLTHQLLAQLFMEQGITLNRVEIYGVYGYDETGFLARISYRRGFRRWVRDVRPSDAIALALSTGAPLFVHASLLSKGTSLSDEAAMTVVEAPLAPPQYQRSPQTQS